MDGMALIGTRHPWEGLLQSHDAGVGLDEALGEAIRYWLGEASRDAALVVVDALIPALRHVRARVPQPDQTRATVVLMADADASWWLHRARVLGLSAIVPVEPWPRRPDGFRRPPGYRHAFGPTHPDSAGSGGPGPELG